jgi:hypothetical protein
MHCLRTCSLYKIKTGLRWLLSPTCEGYHFAPPQIVFDVKPDGCHKPHIVAGGHVVACMVLMVKTLSNQLLDLIAQAQWIVMLG